MEQFSNSELADMSLMYGQCKRNATEAAKEYARRYPNRKHPEANLFLEIDQTLRQTGGFRQPTDGQDGRQLRK